jgi:AP-1 complex subunit gamma-1
MILARFQVAGNTACTGLNFQAAVPKVTSFIYLLFLAYSVVAQSQQLQMLPMSNPDVNPGAVETQQMRVVAPAGVRVIFVGLRRHTNLSPYTF